MIGPQDQKFIKWAEKNCYHSVKILRFKNKDQISVETTPRTGYPNIKKIIITLRHHIEDCPEPEWGELLYTLEDRAMWAYQDFAALPVEAPSG